MHRVFLPQLFIGPCGTLCKVPAGLFFLPSQLPWNVKPALQCISSSPCPQLGSILSHWIKLLNTFHDSFNLTHHCLLVWLQTVDVGLNVQPGFLLIFCFQLPSHLSCSLFAWRLKGGRPIHTLTPSFSAFPKKRQMIVFFQSFKNSPYLHNFSKRTGSQRYHTALPASLNTSHLGCEPVSIQIP